jgi:threonine dehydrogenase-like Zn-dependent dehydrogenase
VTPRLTRRRALALAASAGAAPLAAAALARADVYDDRKKLAKEAVGASVAAEQAAAVAFEAIANGTLVDHAAEAAMRAMLDHAKVHAETLGQAMKDQLDEDPPLPPKRTQIPGLMPLHTQDQALRLAMRLEGRAVATHVTMVQKTHDAVILKAIAGILGSDGQNLVVLRQLLDAPPLPSAFERGVA